MMSPKCQAIQQLAYMKSRMGQSSSRICKTCINWYFHQCGSLCTMNHISMKMPWISSEYPMKGISWPMKTAKLNFIALFLAMNFPWKGNFLFNDSWISYDQRFMSPEFSMKNCHRVFHGPWNHGTRLSENWIFHELISSMSWAMKP